MKHGIFAVLDMVAGQYLEPFFSLTIETAIRSFKQACGEPDHQFAKFPADYALYHVGEWDTAEGIVEPLRGATRKLAMASDYTQLDVELKGNGHG